MTAPSSTPRGEKAPTPGVTWDTVLVRIEQLIDDDASDPRPNRATRRALARANRKKRTAAGTAATQATDRQEQPDA